MIKRYVKRSVLSSINLKNFENRKIGRGGSVGQGIPPIPIYSGIGGFNRPLTIDVIH